MAKQCGVTYHGSSFPSCHGTACTLAEGHEESVFAVTGSPYWPARKHRAYASDGKRLSWYTAAQKIEKQKAKSGEAHR